MNKRMILWIAALVVGGFLGTLGIGWLNDVCDVVATIYCRLFQFVALPTIAVTILCTLMQMSGQKDAGRIFGHTVSYTLLTTFAAAFLALAVYYIVAPEMLPADVIAGISSATTNAPQETYGEHLISVVPNNIIHPFLSANVLSVLIVSAAVGIALCFMQETDNTKTLKKFFLGIQELLFALIKALIWALPLGIVAFSAQLAAQMHDGVVMGSLGKYVLVVMASNLLQIFIVLPLFLLANGLNPIRIFKGMSPALLLALFSKSSAGTLPVTMECAEHNLHINPKVSRFVLPICTTINMNGCAAFILVTSLFVLQNGGMQFGALDLLLWVCLAVISAVGNAGVPMGCYFLTLSLVSGVSGAPVGIMGVILPIYAIIDMVETAENVWSDSCVCNITNKRMGFLKAEK